MKISYTALVTTILIGACSQHQDLGTTCGAPDQPCCTTTAETRQQAPACRDGSVCSQTNAGTVCVSLPAPNDGGSCGNNTQLCCETPSARTCKDGLKCVATQATGGAIYTCTTACGGAGEACCGLAINQPYCNAGFKCQNAGCAPCGAAGQSCCATAGALACYQGLSCDASGSCR
jgi:hypothetical protein